MKRAGRTGALFVASAVLIVAVLLWWLADGGGGDGPVATIGAPLTDEAAAPVFSAPLDESVVGLPRAIDGAPAVVTSDEGAAAQGSASASLHLRVIWGDDGTPAADVHATIVPWGGRDPLFAAFDVRTDARGEWSGGGLPAGKVSAYGDRGGHALVELAPGAAGEMLLEIPPGVSVHGEVIDAESLPVPGAEIWLSDYGNGTRGRVVAVADGAGRFALRGVSQSHAVGARAPPRGASPLRTIRTTEHGELFVTLQLGPLGGALRGFVHDTEGMPIAGASVVVGPEYGWPAPNPRDSTLWSGPPPFRLKSDAAGRFFADGVSAGSTPVAVRASGYSPHATHVTTEPGVEVPVDITLPASAVLSGVVRDTAGAPVAGASIETGRYGDIGWVFAESGADGSYELRDLPIGSCEFVAALRDVGRTTRQLDISAGTRTTWDPVLSLGRSIVGRVVDESGHAVAGLRVDADRESFAAVRKLQDETDEAGRFALHNAEDDTYLVQVHLPAVWWSPPLVTRAGVRPSADELVLVVPDDREPSATVVGRVLDGRGLVPAGLRIMYMPAAVNWGHELPFDASSGRFRGGPWTAGTIHIKVEAEGCSPLWRRDIELAAHREHDLGDIVLDEGGTLVLRAALPQGVLGQHARWSLRDEQGRYEMGAAFEADGTDRRENVASGIWELRVDSRYVALWKRQIVIASGRETVVDLPLERGVRWIFTVRAPVGAQAADLAGYTARITDAAGELVDAPGLSFSADPADDRRYASVQVCLRDGSYTVSIERDGAVLASRSVSLAFGVPLDNTVIDLN